MSRPTQKELLTKALLARGYVLGTGRADRSTKYVTFVSTPTTARSLLKAAECGTVAPHSIFLGKTGACRFSSAGKISGSVPFSERTQARLLEEGRALS